MTADTLCTDEFMEVMGRKLCLPTTRINLSDHEDVLLCAVRDRYCLSKKCTLMYPLSVTCHVCKYQMDHSEFRVVTVKCCRKMLHRQCINGLNKCPYCETPWIFLNCNVCKKECVPLRQQRFDYYEAHYPSRMPCCAADVHDECIYKLRTTVLLATGQ